MKQFMIGIATIGFSTLVILGQTDHSSRHHHHYVTAESNQSPLVKRVAKNINNPKEMNFLKAVEMNDMQAIDTFLSDTQNIHPKTIKAAARIAQTQGNRSLQSRFDVILQDLDIKRRQNQ